jgi:uncharacterized protein YjbI with pentapeptide repeats
MATRVALLARWFSKTCRVRLSTLPRPCSGVIATVTLNLLDATKEAARKNWEYLREGKLTNTDLEGAWLHGADLHGALLQNAVSLRL